jgi:ubiquitin-conjugating enzyme E2 G1
MKARMSFPQDFPLNPPELKFMTKMWHPSSASSHHCTRKSAAHTRTVYSDGKVCISILVPCPREL